MELGPRFKFVPGLLAILTILFLAVASTASAQSGPSFSFDPDDQSGGADSIDAISPYNGQLALTIPIGPTYQVGPGLSFQAKLYYTSRVWGPGTWALWGGGPYVPEPYTVLQGDPAFGLGWSFSMGKIVETSAGVPAGYIAPDGSAHRLYSKRFFGSSPDGYYYTRDGSYLRVQFVNSTTGYRMWAPNGTRTTFGHQVTGYDDPAASYQDDYGRGRNGWHATEIASDYNSYNDKITITYQSSSPWVPYQITIPAIGGSNRVITVSMSGALVYSFSVPTFAGGTGTYTLHHSTHGSILRPIAHPSTNPTPEYLDSITLPESGYSYSFTYIDDFSPPNITAYARGAMESQTTPLGARVNYEYGTWTFYHANVLNRPGLSTCAFPPPVYGPRPIYVNGPGVEPDNLPPIGDCTAPDRAAGIVKRTTTLNNAITKYYQYDFPNGETNSAIGAQTETLVVSPFDAANHQHSTTYLFYASTATSTSGDITGPLVGALARVATFAGDASLNYTGQGDTCSYSQFCATAAKRIERFTYETDSFDSNPGSVDGLEANRRFAQRVTIYKGLADSAAPSGKYHVVDYDFDSNAGQYSLETHSGTIGGTTSDARETATTWTPDTTLWKLDKPQTVHLRATHNGSDFSTVTSTFDTAGYPTQVTIADPTYGSLVHATPRDSTHGFPTSESFTHNGITRTRNLTFDSGTLESSKWSGFNWYSLNNTIDNNTGLVASSKDPAGLTTTFTYDDFGRPLVTTPPGGDAVTIITYDSPAQTTTVTSGGGTEYAWTRTITDQLGRPTEVQRKVASSTVSKYFHYDDQGNTTFESEWGSSSNGTSFTNFDDFGRPKTITKADGTTTTIDYSDTSTYPNSVWKRNVTINNVGGNSSATTYQYDAFGNVITVTEPSPVSGDTTYTYNPQNRLTKVTQGSQTRNFKYDAFGFLRSEDFPEKGNVSITYSSYDPLGNVLTENQPGSVTINRTYDGAGRLLTVSSGSTYLTNCYDGCSGAGGGTYPAGKLTRQTGTNPSATPNISFQQDYTFSNDAGRLSARTTTVSTGAIGTVSEAWRYDRAGNVVQYNHPRTSGLFAVETAYDHGLPVVIRANGLPVVSGATYRASGLLASYSTGNGTGHNVTTTFDADPNSMARPNRIWTSGASTNFDTGVYSYDGAGNVTAMGTDTFKYDRLSRLISAYEGQATICTDSGGNGGRNQCFSYDNYGNLLGVSGVTARTYCSTSCTNNKLPSPATYDGRGNLTKGLSTFGTENYSYDNLDRLWRYYPTGSDFTYEYLGNGERVVKFPTGGAASSYIWAFRDESGRIASEYQGTTLGRDDVYLGSLLVASYSTCSVNGVPGWTYYSSDHLGTPRLITDANGSTVDTRKYWPYGDDLVGAISTQRAQFAAMERDGEGNGSRYYDHARSYDPKSVGRFLGVDSFAITPGNPQRLNRYGFVLGNPLTLFDPSGRADRCAIPSACVFNGGFENGAFVATGVSSSPSFSTDIVGAFVDNQLPDMIRDFATSDSVDPMLGRMLLSVADALPHNYSSIPELVPFLAAIAPEELAAEALAIDIARAAEAAQPGFYTLYRYVNSDTGAVEYVGITINFARRAAEHANRFTGLQVVAENLNYVEARGAEQALINLYGFKKNGGSLLNKINSIARTNPIYDRALEIGTQALRRAAGAR